ncbi:MAG TPA: hypothetical protein DEU90_13080 [Enterobacter asburiae]|nr:hypothetical protein NI40_021720 [Enterobacter sp. E20]KJI62350.1 hypothetical protein UP00_12390 [Enterobacter asburiae]KSX08658.1 hypothetical protein APT79_09350 [Enterobacter sp. K66-74]OJX56173.1 MAG: hypothetical protein BGO85_17805 [Enterobacter sp. 56-7]OAY19070.1 hypothetical protein AXY04_20785 [Enterobacter asburiae]
MRSLQLTAPPFTTGDKSVDTSPGISLLYGSEYTFPWTDAHLRDGGKGRFIIMSINRGVKVFIDN